MSAYDKDNDDDSLEDEFELYSLEEIEEELEERARERDAMGIVDTAHSDGSTTNPQDAMEQGLVYDPPTDPPVVPSDDPDGIEIATGFGDSMEQAGADEYDLPSRVDNQDYDLEEDIQLQLRFNSETGHLDDIWVTVVNGNVRLYGTVPSDDDIAIVEYLVRDIEGVRSVHSMLRVADE